MSLSGILNSAATGLGASQTQIQVISNNIANVNTPGYARELVTQASVTAASGGGVATGAVSLAVDQFLRQTSLTATAQAGSAGAISDVMDQAQALFGDPTSSSGYFSQLSQTFAAFSTAAQNPASSVSRNQTLSAINGFLNQSAQIANGLQALSHQADSQISTNVSQVNQLLTQIDHLNETIVSGTVSGGDVTGAQNTQGQLVNTLSSLIGIQVQARTDGGVDIRGGDTLLVSRGGAAQLSYSPSGANAGQVMVASSGGGTPRPLLPRSGVLQGLLALRNTQIPAVASQVSQYVTQAVSVINQAHNASTAVPPPAQLTGRNTGLDLPTAVSGFTGKTELAIVDSSGVLQSRIDVDFAAGTMTVAGGAPAAFSPGSFLGDLNTALGANGSASFANGALSIQANGSNGVAVADDPAAPSQKAGQGFSQFFGLNDLITSSGIPNTATGLTGTDANGFNAGGVISLQLTDVSGNPLRNAVVTVPAGGDMNSLVAALNDPNNGVGLYGAYGLDSQGRLSFAPSQPGININVISDTSQRGPGGPSMSTLFGLDPHVANNLASTFQVRPDIAANSMKLSFAQLNSSATAGQSALSVGDAAGATLLANAGDQSTTFQPAGGFGAVVSTLAQYGAQLSGSVAQAATTAASNSSNAKAISAEAGNRRSSVEGVNLDEELTNLTTYQQSYNASARLIQAASNLFQILLQLT
jgi:flagellar hook-associated protein 1 FlgK